MVIKHAKSGHENVTLCDIHLDGPSVQMSKFQHVIVDKASEADCADCVVIIENFIAGMYN